MLPRHLYNKFIHIVLRLIEICTILNVSWYMKIIYSNLIIVYNIIYAKLSPKIIKLTVLLWYKNVFLKLLKYYTLLVITMWLNILINNMMANQEPFHYKIVFFINTELSVPTHGKTECYLPTFLYYLLVWYIFVCFFLYLTLLWRYSILY